MTTKDAVEGQIIRIIRENSGPLEPQPVIDPLPGSFPGPGELPRWAGSIKAILFDIYGTMLISAAGDITTSARGFSHIQSSPDRQIPALLQEYGIDKTPERLEELFSAEVINQHQRLRSQGVDHPEIRYPEIWARVLDITGADTDIDSDALKVFAARYEAAMNPIWPMPELQETLAPLKEQKVVMGIISNAQFFTPLLFPALLDKDLIQLGFAPDLLFYSYRYGYAKPSDFLYRKATEALTQRGIQPGETAYIGNDMLNDVLPAQRAGFKGILFAGDRRSLRLRQAHPDCSDTIPHAVVTGIQQILEYF